MSFLMALLAFFIITFSLIFKTQFLVRFFFSFLEIFSYGKFMAYIVGCLGASQLGGSLARDPTRV